MPLNKIEQISDSRFFAVWHIGESSEELKNQLELSASDSSLLHSFRSEKKILEWLSGRLCLKHLCAHLGILYSGVRKNNNGKPFLNNSNAEISLTHSYPYVAAIIDTNDDVGIDLEQPKEKLQKVAHKFLNEDELLHANENINKLCVYWCAKETLYKICDQKLSFRDHMAIEPFKIKKRDGFIGKVIANGTINSYKLEYRIENDYILTYNV